VSGRRSTASDEVTPDALDPYEVMRNDECLPSILSPHDDEPGRWRVREGQSSTATLINPALTLGGRASFRDAPQRRG